MTITETKTLSSKEGRSDLELMEAVSKRKSDAMEEIYRRYEPTLRNVIQSVLHDEGEVDDTLDDVFLQLWDQSDRFDPAKGLHGFLVTMARRRALDRLRRRLAYRRATDRLETELNAYANSEMRAHYSPTPIFDLTDLLRRIIGTLPAAQQEVINLTFFEGLSQREIAARTSIALGTVKTRLQLALKKLFVQLAPVQGLI
jgi:RNA polymerase sigma-70 factor, ECF subfamily